MAVGLNLIFGVMRVVNFAHGGMMVFSALLVYSLVASSGFSPITAVALGTMAVILIGIATQTLALEKVRTVGYQAELLSLLITYGLSLILENVGVVAFGPNYVSLPSLQGSWALGPLTLAKAQTLGGLIGVVASLAVLAWLRYSQSGKRVMATSQNRGGAEACGINTAVVRRNAFGIGSGLAGLAGALFVFEMPITSQMGLPFTILAFVIIAIGGVGKYIGAFAGAAALGIAVVVAGYMWGGTVSSLVPYALLMAVMLVRFRGARNAE